MKQLAVVLLISDGKAYSLHQHLRSLRQLDYPVKRQNWIVVYDQQRSERCLQTVEDFCKRYPRYDVEAIGVTIPEDTSRAEVMHWGMRANIAARMRQAALQTVRETEVDYLFFAGCDMIFPPHTLKNLLHCRALIATGIYQARVSNFPVICSYDRENKTWGPHGYQPEVFNVDWCGMDCALIARQAFMANDWQGFDHSYYNIGEDGWFCLKTSESFGEKVRADGQVVPLHVKSNGMVAYPMEFKADIVRIKCPGCGHTIVNDRFYKDVEVGCPGCRVPYMALPFWEDIDLVQAGAGHQKFSHVY